MADERPLHVLVAEAIGIKVVSQAGEWRRVVTETDQAITTMSLPRSDTSWCATGPLIAKYKLNPIWGGTLGHWEAIDRTEDHDTSYIGYTPLEAICWLILALHKAGKLTPA